MNLKHKMLIIFVICFILMSGQCSTNEADITVIADEEMLLEDTSIIAVEETQTKVTVEEISFEPETETEKKEQITIGGYTYSINRTLEDFTVFNTSFESLDGIEQLEHLKSLTLSRNIVPLRDISAIGKLTELTELAIASEGGEFRVRDIIGASKLESLQIVNNGINGTIDLEGIENFPELEEILLTNCIPINYESLTRLKRLKRLVFVLPEQNTNLQFLTKIPTLESLTLDAANVVGDIYDPTTYIDIDARFLRNMRNLEAIVFEGFHIKNFNVLSELPELDFIGIRAATTDDIDYSLFRDDVSIIDYYDH